VNNLTTTPFLTGTHINYYFICQRKLYLFDHHLSMEHTSDLVHLRRLVHEESYERCGEVFDIASSALKNYIVANKKFLCCST
jgi:CRISPR-associated exonuclease Cas4